MRGRSRRGPKGLGPAALHPAPRTAAVAVLTQTERSVSKKGVRVSISRSAARS